MLDFVKGDPKAPTGNMIAFCKVIGKNPFESDGSIIAVHVVVSNISAKENSFPVVVFPPVSLKNEQELSRVIGFQQKCDVVRLENFQIPSESEEQEYMNDRLEQFNDLVRDYVDLYQKYYETVSPKLGEEIKLLAGPQEGKSQDSEEETLKKLQDLLKVGAGPVDFSPVIRHIKTHFPQYDIHNFEKSIHQDQTEIASLYIKKFFAIHEERYEAAALFQARIMQMESARP
ncbi:MAG: hypothetical protein KDK37_03810 [Leptospiraceae bacterium]|nr:hypothetical protein [Leptospiraceae bacterium]MCB1303371.1 hypothetical protein [Leptospiraceae bacterium]